MRQKSKSELFENRKVKFMKVEEKNPRYFKFSMWPLSCLASGMQEGGCNFPPSLPPKASEGGGFVLDVSFVTNKHRFLST